MQASAQREEAVGGISRYDGPGQWDIVERSKHCEREDEWESEWDTHALMVCLGMSPVERYSLNVWETTHREFAGSC